ncbi:MAG: hypothetical protein KJZ62_00190 [Fimbriimonadaceae bacterium]|nr:hypothetical protein [Fimbriimonadaceae bacterium]QOJ11249.1 MAG: hypothetical protein HRU74_03980 [Chthonomonadaceae bacterium]
MNFGEMLARVSRGGRVIAGGLLAGIAAFASGQEFGPPTFSHETTWNSKYVWRGLVLDDKPVLQTSNTLSFGDTSFNVWASRRACQVLSGRGGTELDLTLSRDVSWGWATVTPALIYYSYPGMGAPPSAEAAISLSAETGPVTFFSNHFLDFAECAGGYFGEAGLGWERSMSPNLTLGGDAAVGWGNKKFHVVNYGAGKDSVTTFAVRVYADFQLSGRVFAQPTVTYSRVLDGALRSVSSSPDQLVWGLTLGFRG